ncbi:MAG: N-acetylmuramoyl-L-alanine amidase [Lachnospiraceae bacterium]|nr:N-acetylmuramoyl-L-alanine amidase [Lachnospiraceae bacterium]
MQKKRMYLLILIMVIVFSVLAGCGGGKTEELTVLPIPEETEEPIMEEAVEDTAEPTVAPTEEPTAEPTTEPTEEPTAEPEITVPEYSDDKLIVIDAGHQAKGNSEKEPIGPVASEMKAKVTGGATGGTTGQKEYELNLAVSFYLRDELVARGYEVIMVRESHDVNLSNSERAQVANQAGADAFIRIHANGSDNTTVNGTETLCQTAGNPYNASIYPLSRSLSGHVLKGIVNQTSSKDRGVKETDTMSGINWCNVPTTIVEMGFLSNPDEDALLFTEEYRKKVALGIANGIDAYFEENT